MKSACALLATLAVSCSGDLKRTKAQSSSGHNHSHYRYSVHAHRRREAPRQVRQLGLWRLQPSGGEGGGLTFTGGINRTVLYTYLSSAELYTEHPLNESSTDNFFSEDPWPDRMQSVRARTLGANASERAR